MPIATGRPDVPWGNPVSIATVYFSSMLGDLASRAKSDQILLGVLSGLTAKSSVVNFEVGSTRLTTPAIAMQDLQP
jgi:hypothetical protein